MTELLELGQLALVFGGSGLAVRSWARARARRPRLCSCSHGPGLHTTGGCKGRVMYVEGVRLKNPEWCGCQFDDASGHRAPR